MNVIKEIEKIEKTVIELMKIEQAENKHFKNYMLILEHRINDIIINNYPNSYDEGLKYMIHGKINSLISFYMTDKIFSYDYFSLKADLLNDLNNLIAYELNLREKE